MQQLKSQTLLMKNAFRNELEDIELRVHQAINKEFEYFQKRFTLVYERCVQATDDQISHLFQQCHYRRRSSLTEVNRLSPRPRSPGSPSNASPSSLATTPTLTENSPSLFDYELNLRNATVRHRHRRY
jgi:hypothetical protein